MWSRYQQEINASFFACIYIYIYIYIYLMRQFYLIWNITIWKRYNHFVLNEWEKEPSEDHYNHSNTSLISPFATALNTKYTRDLSSMTMGDIMDVQMGQLWHEQLWFSLFTLFFFPFECTDSHLKYCSAKLYAIWRSSHAHK